MPELKLLKEPVSVIIKAKERDGGGLDNHQDKQNGIKSAFFNENYFCLLTTIIISLHIVSHYIFSS